MIAEVFRPETVQGMGNLFFTAIPILGMAFSVAQRDWFKRVYKDACQGKRIGMKHKCNHDIQIHHVAPQAWSYEHGLTEDQIDTATNGFPLCSDAHVGTRGTKDCIHPDQAQTADDFRKGDKEAYFKLQDRRKRMAQTDVPYWNTRWDRNMDGIIKATVYKYQHDHPDDPFPPKNHRNGHNGNGK